MRAPTVDEVRDTYRRALTDPREERRLLATIAFGTTFATVRVITHAIRDNRGPFRNITPGGRHIHHMTFGIIGVIGVGYAWLNEFGIADAKGGRRASRATALVYGAGSALTLDEFALWLNLADDYWTAQGRESIDAVVLFGSLLSLAASGHRLAAELARLTKRTLTEN